MLTSRKIEVIGRPTSNIGPGPGFEPSSRDPQSLRITTTLSRHARPSIRFWKIKLSPKGEGMCFEDRDLGRLVFSRTPSPPSPQRALLDPQACSDNRQFPGCSGPLQHTYPCLPGLCRRGRTHRAAMPPTGTPTQCRGSECECRLCRG